MERIVSLWERLLSAIVFLVSYLGFQLFILYNTEYTPYRTLRVSKLYIVFGFSGIVILYFLMIYFISKIEISRIEAIGAKVIYRHKRRISKYKYIIITLCIVLYMLNIVIGNTIISSMFVFFIVTFHLLLRENIVYGGEGYFILEGIKYNHGSISNWHFGDLYSFYCDIDGKERKVSCMTYKRYEFLEGYFVENLTDSKASANDCT